MDKRRLDNILGGAILLLSLMDYLELSRLQTTNYALRDGLILDVQAKADR
jgi:exopolyphosphatase/pppGpp-phosphohydrolase